MRSNLKKPFRVDLNNISHILLSCHHKLMIDNTLRFIFVKHRTWMDSHTHSIFNCFVYFISVQFSAIHEKTLYYTLSDVGILIIFIDA